MLWSFGDEFSYQTCSFGAKNVRPVRSWNSPTWSWPPDDWTRHTLATSAISIFHQTGKFPNKRYCGMNITLKTKGIWKNTSPHHLSKKCIIYTYYTPIICFFVKKLSNDLNTNNSTGPRKSKIPIILVGRSTWNCPHVGLPTWQSYWKIANMEYPRPWSPGSLVPVFSWWFYYGTLLAGLVGGEWQVWCVAHV